MPAGWLLGCVFIRMNENTIHPDLTREEGHRLLQVGFDLIWGAAARSPPLCLSLLWARRRFWSVSGL